MFQILNSRHYLRNIKSEELPAVKGLKKKSKDLNSQHATAFLKEYSMSIGYRLLLLSLSIAVLPFVPVVISKFVAFILGCQVHEGFSNTCQIGTYDIGGMLNAMFTMFWYGLVAIPIGTVGALIAIVWLAVASFFNKET